MAKLIKRFYHNQGNSSDLQQNMQEKKNFYSLKCLINSTKRIFLDCQTYNYTYFLLINLQLVKQQN